MKEEISLELLGLTKEELQERVINTICSHLLDANEEEDGGIYPEWRESLRRLMVEKIDEKVVEIANREVPSKIEELIESITLQRTNEWGERAGQRVTFIEYLVHRAEEYLREKVTYEGKKPDNYHRPTQERIAYLIDRHLHLSIETAMKNALMITNSAIAEGIAETVKMKLEEILKTLKVDVKC